MSDIRPDAHLIADPAEILCPRRHQHISSLVCHECGNHLPVQRRSEMSPELQCSCYDFSPLGLREEGSLNRTRQRT